MPFVCVTSVPKLLYAAVTLPREAYGAAFAAPPRSYSTRPVQSPQSTGSSEVGRTRSASVP